MSRAPARGRVRGPRAGRGRGGGRGVVPPPITAPVTAPIHSGDAALTGVVAPVAAPLSPSSKTAASLASTGGMTSGGAKLWEAYLKKFPLSGPSGSGSGSGSGSSPPAPPPPSIPLHSGGGSHAMSGSSGGDGSGASSGALGGISAGGSGGPPPPPPPGPDKTPPPYTSAPKKKKATVSKTSAMVPPKIPSPKKGTRARPSPPRVSPTKSILSKYRKYGSPPKMGALDATIASIKPASDAGGHGARGSEAAETESSVDAGLQNLMQVRMLPSLQRKLELTPTKYSLDKDLTINASAITPASENRFKTHVLDVNDRDQRMRELRTYINNMNAIDFKNDREKVDWEIARSVVDPEIVKNFADDDDSYRKLLADFLADINNRGLNLRGDWKKSPVLLAYSGYERWSKPVHAAINKAAQSRNRIKQLAGLIALYKNSNNLTAIQQILGGTGSSAAKEIQDFNFRERMNIANLETHQTATPDKIIQHLRDSGHFKKLSPPGQAALREIYQNFKEDLVAREHGYLESNDFIEKVATYNEALRKIADEEKDPDFYKALTNSVTEIQKKNLIDWRIFNERIKFIDETIAKSPNHLLAKKLTKLKNEIVEGLKNTKDDKIDLTKAYDKMNGIYNLINNEYDKYNAFARKYGLKELAADERTKLLEHTRYTEQDTQEDVKGPLRPELDVFKDKEQTKTYFAKLRADNIFAFPTVKIVGRKLGIPITTGVRYLNKVDRSRLDNEMAHLLTTDVKFDMEQEEKGKTGRVKTQASTNMTDLVYGGHEIKLASGGFVNIPFGGWKDTRDITDEFSTKSLLNLRTALKDAVERGSRQALKINTRVYHNLSHTGHIVAQSAKKLGPGETVSPKGKILIEVKGVSKKKTSKGKDIETSVLVPKKKLAKQELASDIIDLLNDLRNIPEFIKNIDTAPELTVKDAKSVAVLKVFPGSKQIFQPSTSVPKKLPSSIPVTGIKAKPAPELIIDNEVKSASERRKLKEQREKKYSEANFKFARKISKEEPEVNKAYYGDRHIEYDVKNEADLLRMKNEVTKMKGKLYVVDLHTGRLFPIDLEHTFINQNYIFVKDLRSESKPPPTTTKKTKGKKETKNLKGGGFGAAVSHAAYYPVLNSIFRDEEEQMPNIFMRNGRDKAKQMIHLAAQNPHFNDYRDQIRHEKGAGMWKYVRKSLQEGAKQTGKYIANRTVSAAKDFGKQSVYEGKHFVNQQKRNINYIGNANKQFYKDPSFGNFNKAVNKTLLGSIRVASQPLITTARETANASDFVGRIPGLNVVKSGINFFVPPVAMADALVHGVKNVDDGKYIDAAINAGDALIGSGKLNRGVEMGARLLNTGLKVADRFGLDKDHNKQPPP